MLGTGPPGRGPDDALGAEKDVGAADRFKTLPRSPLPGGNWRSCQSGRDVGAP